MIGAGTILAAARKVPVWAWVLVAVAVLAGVAAAVQTLRVGALQVELGQEVAAHAETRSARDEQLALMERTAREAGDAEREKERLKNQANAKVNDDAREQIVRAHAAADRVRSEREQLRTQLAEVRADTAGGDQSSADPAACRRAHASAAVLGELFEQCTGRYEAVAAAAGGLAAQVSGLQAYVREVVHGGEP